MKIKLEGYEFLKERLETEGTELVNNDWDIRLNEMSEGKIPRSIVESLGVDLVEGEELFRFVKLFNKDFSPQTLVAIPIVGMMNGGLGYNTTVGMGCRFVNTEPDIFFNQSFTDTLNEMDFTGFISALMSPHGLIELRMGAGMALYNILEGVQGRLEDFLSLKERLLESWTLSVALSRYPYPYENKFKPVSFVVSKKAQEHFYPFKCSQRKNLFSTEHTFVGLATSWATTLQEAEKRVLRTLNGIELPAKQYRTDLCQAVRWQDVKDYAETS